MGHDEYHIRIRKKRIIFKSFIIRLRRLCFTMTAIHDINQPFPFEKLRLSTPFSRNGGYFMKFLMDEGPLYLQPPKSSVKQGFVKSGKKILCDLIFSNENDRFLTWLEKLEEYAQQIIYDNRSKWFETELDRHDIESSITSPYKMYKSGKFYIIRTNVPIALGKCDLKIYDENELEVNHDDIKENTNVMTILEFKGIKCSSRSFQFEIELKQMLVMKPDLLFEKCILHRTSGGGAIGSASTPVLPPQTPHVLVEVDPSVPVLDTAPVCEPSVKETVAKAPVAYPPLERLPPTAAQIPKRDSSPEKVQVASPPSISVPVQQPSPPSPSKAVESPEICEVDFDLVDIMPEEKPVQLKNRNEVYYKMYKEAKRLAKEAKMIALSNYLEAKRIKSTYMLDDLDDSDEDQLDEFISKNSHSSGK